MSARECGLCDGQGMCDYGEGDEEFRSCNGTGKVWPSVPGEIVVEQTAISVFHGCMTLLIHVAEDDTRKYRLIVQPVESEAKS